MMRTTGSRVVMPRAPDCEPRMEASPRRSSRVKWPAVPSRRRPPAPAGAQPEAAPAVDANAIVLEFKPPAEKPVPKIVVRMSQQDVNGATPLHVAAECGHAAVVSALCDKCAPVDVADARGNTPLHAAALFGQHDAAVELLRRGADKHIRNDARLTPAQVAAAAGCEQLALFIESPPVSLQSFGHPVALVRSSRPFCLSPIPCASGEGPSAALTANPRESRLV